MVKILVVCCAVHLLSFVAGCGIGKLFRVGQAEDIADQQDGNGGFDGSVLNTPLPSSIRVET